MLVCHANMNNTKRTRRILMRPARPDTGRSYEIDKKILCTAAQMLQENECTNIQLDQNTFLKIRHTGQNNFSVQCTLSAYNTDHILQYLNEQRIPFHNKATEISTKLQDHLGFFPVHRPLQNKYMRRRVSDTFLADNATVISKLTDFMNINLQSKISPACLLSNQNETSFVYSHNYCAQLLRNAAIFCATALKDKACMWHISQEAITDFPKEAQTSLYEGMEPEKQHVTLLLKGNSVQERIMRINLAVRIFPKDHNFTKNILPMPMNSCPATTSVMLLSGVNSQVAAAIYTNAQSTSNIRMNNLVLNPYLP
jgi:hypothetical protein